MNAPGFLEIIRADPQDRTDLFLGTAQRMGVPLVNVEKDFWVCWTLNTLYHRLPSNGPRLLFKGGTSLSKAFGLINRFSEDIDVTVFRDDIGHPAPFEELAALSNKKRKAALEQIAEDCRAYINGDLQTCLSELLADDTSGKGRIEADVADQSGQTLLVWYPRVDQSNTEYVQAAVKIESGAKSALDPNEPKTIRPYIAEDADTLDFAVTDVTTIKVERTYWDKIVIAHGLRAWFERRGELRQEGQRISRHYYDLHCLYSSEFGRTATANMGLGSECVSHARLFFNRPDYDLASAKPGSFNVMPADQMVERLAADYTQMSSMIFGKPPSFDEILASISRMEAELNA